MLHEESIEKANSKRISNISLIISCCLLLSISVNLIGGIILLGQISDKNEAIKERNSAQRLLESLADENHNLQMKLSPK